jgi:hypothetical protein
VSFSLRLKRTQFTKRQPEIDVPARQPNSADYGGTVFASSTVPALHGRLRGNAALTFLKIRELVRLKILTGPIGRRIPLLL